MAWIYTLRRIGRQTVLWEISCVFLPVVEYVGELSKPEHQEIRPFRTAYRISSGMPRKLSFCMILER